MKHLFLFDVDGVLVDAQGYLRALQDTIGHFSRAMGLGDQSPSEREVRVFEANGLTSEWDSAPMCVMALLIARLRQTPLVQLPASWPDAFSTLAARPTPGGSFPRSDYAGLANQVGLRIQAGLSPARAVCAVLEGEMETDPRLTPARSTLAALSEALLGHTHDFYRAPMTRYFQHLVLGSQAIAKTYAVPPDFDSPPYLSLYDRPLLEPTARTQLHAHMADGQVRGVIYTLRPSLPPADANTQTTGYSPEAEMARALVGLESLPLIGQGRLRWLALQTGEPLNELVKPSPVQALAAIGAAWSGQEGAALGAALRLHRTETLKPPLAGLEPVTVHVFEDSPGGLRAVERGVEALRAAGALVSWQPYGVVSPGSPKAAALTEQGMPVYPSVNEAVMAALKRI